MTIIIQIVVIVIALAIVGVALGKRGTHLGRASKKIGLIFLAVAMVVAVVFPEITNTIASVVGVGRGADLILYVTVVAFILYALNNYLHQQDQRDMIFKLARRIAVNEAKNKNKEKDSK